MTTATAFRAVVLRPRAKPDVGAASQAA
jgi:hypothetical protein